MYIYSRIASYFTYALDVCLAIVWVGILPRSYISLHLLYLAHSFLYTLLVALKGDFIQTILQHQRQQLDTHESGGSCA